MKTEMKTETMYLDCPNCNFPVGTPNIFLRCPFCNKESNLEVAMRGKSQVQQVVGERIAGSSFDLWTAIIAFGVGVVFGPTIMTASRYGAQRMAEMAEKKLRKG